MWCPKFPMIGLIVRSDSRDGSDYKGRARRVIADGCLIMLDNVNRIGVYILYHHHMYINFISTANDDKSHSVILTLFRRNDEDRSNFKK